MFFWWCNKCVWTCWKIQIEWWLSMYVCIIYLPFIYWIYLVYIGYYIGYIIIIYINNEIYSMIYWYISWHIDIFRNILIYFMIYWYLSWYIDIFPDIFQHPNTNHTIHDIIKMAVGNSMSHTPPPPSENEQHISQRRWNRVHCIVSNSTLHLYNSCLWFLPVLSPIPKGRMYCYLWRRLPICFTLWQMHLLGGGMGVGK